MLPLLTPEVASTDAMGPAIAGLILVLGAIGKYATRAKAEDKPVLVKVDAAAFYSDLLEVLRGRGPSLIGGPIKGDWQRTIRHGSEAIESLLNDFDKLVTRVEVLWQREQARIDDEKIEAKARELEEERARRHRQSDDFPDAEHAPTGSRRPRKEP